MFYDDQYYHDIPANLIPNIRFLEQKSLKGLAPFTYTVKL